MPIQVRPELLGDSACGAGAEERVEHDVARIGRGEDHPVQERFRLLRRMGFLARLVLDPLPAVADRQQPIGPHLKVVVERLHGIVIEGVGLLIGVARGQTMVS